MAVKACGLLVLYTVQKQLMLLESVSMSCALIMLSENTKYFLNLLSSVELSDVSAGNVSVSGSEKKKLHSSEIA